MKFVFDPERLKFVDKALFVNITILINDNNTSFCDGYDLSVGKNGTTLQIVHFSYSCDTRYNKNCPKLQLSL